MKRIEWKVKAKVVDAINSNKMTVKEASKKFGLNVNTIYQWMKRSKKAEGSFTDLEKQAAVEIIRDQKNTKPLITDENTSQSNLSVTAIEKEIASSKDLPDPDCLASDIEIQRTINRLEHNRDILKNDIQGIDITIMGLKTFLK